MRRNTWQYCYLRTGRHRFLCGRKSLYHAGPLLREDSLSIECDNKHRTYLWPSRAAQPAQGCCNCLTDSSPLRAVIKSYQTPFNIISIKILLTVTIVFLSNSKFAFQPFEANRTACLRYTGSTLIVLLEHPVCLAPRICMGLHGQAGTSKGKS